MRILAVVNVCCLAAFAVLQLSGFRAQAVTRVDLLEANRINILGPNGRPVLVLANRDRIPGPILDGREYPRVLAEGREVLSGMIFLNEQGDEVGGLIYGGLTRDSGYSAVGHLSLDQWKQNQVVALQYVDNARTRRAGLTVWDRPTTVPLRDQFDRAERLLAATGSERDSLLRARAEARARGENGEPRLFIGSQDRTAMLQLRDTKGRVRLRLSVDSADVPRIEVLDESGKVLSTFPQGAGR